MGDNGQKQQIDVLFTQKQGPKILSNFTALHADFYHHQHLFYSFNNMSLSSSAGPWQSFVKQLGDRKHGEI